MDYLSGFISGTVCIDSVNIAGLKVKRQPFILVQKDLSRSLGGRLGLAFERLSNNFTTLIENLKHQGQVSKAVFAFDLRDSELGEEYQPSISFGGYDLGILENGAKDSDINWLKVHSETGYWALAATSLTFGSYKDTTKRLAILNTGTQSTYSPAQIVKDLSAYLIENHNCEVNGGLLVCFCNQSFPDLEFSLGGKSYSFPPESYLFNYFTTCILSLEVSSSDDWHFGVSFLKAYYSIFDMDKQRIALVSTSKDSEKDNGADFNWLVIGYGLGAVVLVVLGFLAGFFFNKYWRRAPLNPAPLTEQYVSMTSINEKS